MLLFLWSCFWSDIANEQEFVNEGDWIVFMEGEANDPVPQERNGEHVPQEAVAEQKSSDDDLESNEPPHSPLDLNALRENPFANEAPGHPELLQVPVEDALLGKSIYHCRALQ